jgi:hypothetical protein
MVSWLDRDSMAGDMATLQSMLEKGYFPRELPPPFHTTSFANYAVVNGAAWRKGKWMRCATHNLARPGGIRRPLKIPNPIPFFDLAQVLSNDWTRIRAHTWTVRLSASRPYVMKNSSRAVVARYTLRERPRLRALRRRIDRYLLHTDISQFYPSLYTHAIPWAIDTKAVCKAALLTAGRGANLLGNRIDSALRCMNDGQTHGIPIGPDTSLVTAEILLAAVDQEILAQHGSLIRGFRYIDDYELSFAKLSDAEQILTNLQGILAEFELSLNARKTKVTELPALLDDDWAIELGRFNIRDATSPAGQRNDIVALFSRAYEVVSERPEQPVIRYVVARVRSQNIAVGAWRAFQNCILGAIGADSSSLGAGLGTLHLVGTAGAHSIAKLPLGDILEAIIKRHAPRGEGSEVAWALWGAMAWSVSLGFDSARLVSAMNDDIVALMALNADAKGLFPAGALDRHLWQNLLNQPDILWTEHWLLAYEANRQKWLVCPAVSVDAIFAAMEKAGVSFYDPARNVPQYPLGAMSIPGGSLPDYYA